MTHARPIRRRTAALALVALGAALALLPGTAAAKQAPAGAWFGWGTKFRVDANGAPKVTFVAYVAEDGTPIRVLASKETDLACDELGNGSITYDGVAGTAAFDGASYLACQLPSWEEATSEIGYDLPDTGECMVCATGGAPIWGDMAVTPALGVSGTMPIIDASDAGIRLSVETTGATAHSRLDIDRVLGTTSINTYRSSNWDIATSPLAHTVVGMEGDGIVAIADYFNWLDYLTGTWRPWFKSVVEGAKVGSWEEETTSPQKGTVTGRQYELGVDGGELYIGYSPDSGDFFQGTLGPGGIEPGCKGL